VGKVIIVTVFDGGGRGTMVTESGDESTSSLMSRSLLGRVAAKIAGKAARSRVVKRIFNQRMMYQSVGSGGVCMSVL
jgi:hypothetical protein